jgi:hypothetical protein
VFYVTWFIFCIRQRCYNIGAYCFCRESHWQYSPILKGGHCGCDCMVVGFINTYAISHYQCLSPLTLWVRIPLTKLCDKVCQWLATGRWFSLGTLVSSTKKTDHHDITEILLKVALNTINQPNMETLFLSAGDLSLFYIFWGSWNKFLVTIDFSCCIYP